MLRGLAVTGALFVTGAGIALTAIAFSGTSGSAAPAAAPASPAATAAASPGVPRPGTAVPAGPGPSASSPKPPNAADLTFALGMVPHHAQAVEMSRIVLAKPGVHHLVTTLAERILADQRREITDMNAWLAAWGQDPIPADSQAAASHAAHHGGTGAACSPPSRWPV
ncbi:DUF305 domain-containing protein [Streptodolium elevatio]